MGRRVILIRHAERPVDDVRGVDARGRRDKESLTPRGWQRAGALVPLFARGVDARLPRPKALFAAFDEDRSLRPRQTLEPLAAALALPLQTLASSGLPAQQAAARALLASPEPALVCWRHEELPLLARALTGIDAPAWQPDCYDLAWLCTRGRGGWALDPVGLRLLDGDRA